MAFRLPSFDWLTLAKKPWVKGKSSINLTSLVAFEHHSMAETIRHEKEDKKIKVKAPVTAKKNKQHQTSKPCRFQTSAAAAVKPCQNVRLIKLRRVQVVSLPRRDWFRR